MQIKPNSWARKPIELMRIKEKKKIVKPNCEVTKTSIGQKTKNIEGGESTQMQNGNRYWISAMKLALQIAFSLFLSLSLFINAVKIPHNHFAIYKTHLRDKITISSCGVIYLDRLQAKMMQQFLKNELKSNNLNCN